MSRAAKDTATSASETRGSELKATRVWPGSPISGVAVGCPEDGGVGLITPTRAAHRSPLPSPAPGQASLACTQAWGLRLVPASGSFCLQPVLCLSRCALQSARRLLAKLVLENQDEPQEHAHGI